nr:TPM domain-containing protein [Bdellovibrionales bacterium]
GSEIQVVTVNDLGGASIEEAGIRLADAWKLGNAKEDNGVILLVAKTERRVRIEVGQGREGVLPDIVASRIIREVITPRFKQGQIDQGVRDGVLAIVHYTDPEFLKDGPAAANQKSGGGLLKLIILILFFTFMFVGPFFGRRGRRGMFGGGSSWGGSSWGGGGGGFSGGGASGSW